MTIERTCEVVVFDGDVEVTCGGVAVERIHGWWIRGECLSEARRLDLDGNRDAAQ